MAIKTNYKYTLHISQSYLVVMMSVVVQMRRHFMCYLTVKLLFHFKEFFCFQSRLIQLSFQSMPSIWLIVKAMNYDHDDDRLYSGGGNNWSLHFEIV